ncbi:MAG: mechanosensitive ion channel [Flavobacterium sp.]|nr:mechanosensitive ion channel [Flavobacterium sp.]
MELLNQLKSDTFETLNVLFYKIGEGIISFLYALIVLIIGWFVTKLVIYVFGKALDLSRIENLSTKINEADFFGKSEIKISLKQIILSFTKWILILVFFIIAADVMQWKIISEEISHLLRYLPKLFSAIVLFMIGIYIANFVRKTIFVMFQSFDLSGSKIISSIVFYGISSLITITALNQAGIDTSIITNNITIIFGSFLLTFALAFGFGSKEVIKKLLLSFYSRKNYQVNDVIKVNNIQGKIESIDNICVTLLTEKGKIIIPIEEIVESKVEILQNESNQ